MGTHNNQDSTVLIVAGNRLGTYGQHLNTRTRGQLGHALQAAGFTGAPNEAVTLLAAAGQNRICVVSAGSSGKTSSTALMNAGGTAYQKLTGTPVRQVSMVCDFPDLVGDSSITSPEAWAVHGFMLAAYRWRTDGKGEQLALAAPAASKKRSQLAEQSNLLLDAEREGVFLARDLATAPANLMGPEAFADQCRRLRETGLKVTILNQNKLRDLGMGGLLAVAQGSHRKPVLAVLEWPGQDPGQDPRQAPVTLIGKGVTFDSGGYQLKNTNGITDMHYDKAGAATVAGIMNALARRRSPTHVVGILALTENRIGPDAIEPNAIITMMNGKKVEITNTDAEGRLILADAMTYAQQHHNPRLMIDFATLTGAVGVALGSNYAGLFCNNRTLGQQILTAGRQTGEQLWQLPTDYHGKLAGKNSDHVNWASGAGASVAAAFLDLFVERYRGRPLPHAHIDLAETAWKSSGTPVCCSGVGSGWGVRLANRLLMNMER